MYVIFAIPTNYRMEVEQHTHKGRIDITIHTQRRIYILELKFNGSAKEAVEQIKSRGYADSFKLDGRPVTLVGINLTLDKDKKNIPEWDIA